jgi:amino acid adenylation domain-containing protein
MTQGNVTATLTLDNGAIRRPVVAGGPESSAQNAGMRWLQDGQRPLDWNGPTGRTFIRFADEDLDRPIIDHFERAARRHPDRVAVTDAASSLSYAELWDGLSGLAETIAAETEPGDLVAIVLPTCSMFPLAILACLAAGRPFVALDPSYPDNWLRQVLEDARPALIIGQQDVLSDAPTTRVIHLSRVPRRAQKTWRPAELAVDEPACVLFTSGSTGRPKGIVNSQRSLLQRAAQSINAAHINADDRFLTLASLCTIVGVRDTITALLAGASVHLLDPQRAGAREIVHVIRTEAITILFAFPALIRSVLGQAGDRAGQALRLVRIGGDTTLWSDIDLLRGWLAPEADIQVIYAATEAPMMQWFVDVSCRAKDLSAQALTKADPRIPIGYPLPGNRLALVDDHGGDTPPGGIGELVVESPYVALGRWVDGRYGSIESNGAPSRRLFRTGDLVRQRPDGLLERIGRKDRQVKIRGSRVDLDGVESMIREHPSVKDVAAVARPGADDTMTLVAYVSPRDHAPAELIEELKATMRSAPPPMRPARFYLAPSVPRLPGSKLDLRALAVLDEARVRRERAESIDDAELASIAGDPISKAVARAWQEVLLVPVRAADDDFFDSGGDSLKAITFVIELERTLGIEISLTLINELPKFDQLCQALRERRAPASTPLVTLKAGNGLPPVFFIHGAGGNVVKLLQAARRMTYPGAVIGVRARGVVRGEVPHTSIEAMASDYLREIRERQPNGPYYLCGYSSGGLVAFEIARRLSESGDEVGLVGLFDTRVSRVRWPLRTWLSIVGQSIGLLASVRVTSIRTWRGALRAWVERLRVWRSSLGAASSTAIGVTASGLIAAAKYRPGFYRGQLTLFAPAGRAPGLASLDSIWHQHARTVVVVETTGTHATMLHAEMTAACLTRCLPRTHPVHATPPAAS